MKRVNVKYLWWRRLWQFMVVDVYKLQFDHDGRIGVISSDAKDDDPKIEKLYAETRKVGNAIDRSARVYARRHGMHIFGTAADKYRNDAVTRYIEVVKERGIDPAAPVC